MPSSGSSSLKISLEVDNESALPRFLEGRVSVHLRGLFIDVSASTFLLTFSLVSTSLWYFSFNTKNISIIGWPFANGETVAEES